MRGERAPTAAWTALLETLARWPHPGTVAVERRITRRGRRLTESVLISDDAAGLRVGGGDEVQALLAPLSDAVPLHPTDSAPPVPSAVAVLDHIEPRTSSAGAVGALLDAAAKDLLGTTGPAGVGIVVWRGPWSEALDEPERPSVVRLDAHTELHLAARLPLRCAVRVWSGEAVPAGLLARVAALAGARGEDWEYACGATALEQARADLAAARPPAALAGPSMSVDDDERGFPVAKVARLLADPWTNRGTSKAQWLGRPHDGHLQSYGVVLGRVTSRAGQRRAMRLPWEQRALHTFVCGGTGSGKSQLIARMAAHDLDRGRAVVLLDPHGDLADLVLGLVPPERAHEVVLIDPASERTAAIDVLPPTGDVAQRVGALNDGLAQMSGDTFQFTRWRRRATLAVAAIDEAPNVDTTVHALDRFLTDEQVRIGLQLSLGESRMARRLAKSDRMFWDGAQRSGPLVASAARHAFDHAPRYRLDTHLAGGHVVIARLGLGTLGSADVTSIGTLFLARLLAAIASLEPSTSRQMSVFVDEAHLFAGGRVLGAMLAQTRKFGAALTLATQTPSRLGALLPEVLTNCATTLAMKLPICEASAFSDIAGPQSVRTIGRLPRFHAVILGEGHDPEKEPVVLHPLPALAADTDRAGSVRRSAERRYGRPQEADQRSDLESLARMADDAEDRLSETTGHVSRGDFWRHRAELREQATEPKPPTLWTPTDERPLTPPDPDPQPAIAPHARSALPSAKPSPRT